MASDIKSIDDQVKVLVDNIKKLQDEIKTYQSGYKAFETASAALEALAKTQGGLSDSLASSLKTLEKIDAVAIMKRIDETADKLSSIASSIEKLAKEMNFKEEVAELKKQNDQIAKQLASSIEKLAKEMNFKEEVAELKKQNDQIAKQLASLNSRLDEGVAVKKKKWFA